MARRKKTSPLEDWIDLAAMLPWWGGVLLALVSYVFLHGLAGGGPGAPVKPGDIGSMLIGGLISNFAYWGQFLVPAICLIGALVSFLRRKNRESLLTNVAQSQAADSLEQVSWSEFELLVGEAFRLQGYRVAELGGAGADGGVDLILHKGNEKFLVQCKQWKAYKVSVMVVRELYGVMAAKGAAWRLCSYIRELHQRRGGVRRWSQHHAGRWRPPVQHDQTSPACARRCSSGV